MSENPYRREDLRKAWTAGKRASLKYDYTAFIRGWRFLSEKRYKEEERRLYQEWSARRK